MKLKVCFILALVAIAVFALGTASSAQYCCCWYDYHPGMQDWYSPEGCTSCGGGSGDDVSIEMSQGITHWKSNIPGYPEYTVGGGRSGQICVGIGRICLMTECGTYTFTPDANDPNKWTCASDPSLSMTTTRDGSNNVTGVDIATADGSTTHYSVTGNGTTMPSSQTDRFGRTIIYDYENPASDKLQSVTYPDGTSYQYGYDGSGSLNSVTYPDGNIRMIVSGSRTTYVDPSSYQSGPLDDYSSYNTWTATISSTSGDQYGYTIDDVRKESRTDGGDVIAKKTITRICSKSDYPEWTKYIIEMDDPDYANEHLDEFRPPTDSNPNPPKCYSMTKISCDSDGVVTTRKYAHVDGLFWWNDEWIFLSYWDVRDPEDTTYMPTDDDNSDGLTDRVSERWYYRNSSDTKNTFLQKEVEKWYVGTSTTQRTTETIYNREDDPDDPLTYGRIISIQRSHDGGTPETVTSYTYYEPETQYTVTEDNAAYPSMTGSVYGNGEVMTMTDVLGQTTTYTYKVIDSKMTPYGTKVDFIDEADETTTTKYVINPDYTVSIPQPTGTIAEVWAQDTGTTLEKTKSYIYYVEHEAQTGIDYYVSSNDPRLGNIYQETIHDVSSAGEDMVILNTYSYSNGAETATVTCNGKSAVSHTTNLGLMDWTRDENNRTTNYSYDWRDRLIQTTYPTVTTLDDSGNSVQRTYTTESHYDCCNLTWTQDENKNGQGVGHRRYYGYDRLGRVVKEWSDIQGDETLSDTSNPLVRYTYNAFGEKAVVTTYDTSTSTGRTTAYSYDARGKLVKIVAPSTSIGNEEYLYDEYRRLAIAKDGSGKKTAYQYNSADRLTAIDYDYNGSLSLPVNISSADISYSYPDATHVRMATVTVNKNLVGEVGLTQNPTATYKADKRGRLIEYQPLLPVDYGKITYTWNNLGDKTSMTVPMGISNQSGTVDNARRHEYYYDKSGRQVGTNVIPCQADNNIATFNLGTAGDSTYFYYDHNNSRIKLLNKAGKTYYFVYDPTAYTPSVVFEAVRTSESSVTSYLNIREPDGSLIRRERYIGSSLDGSFTYHFDGLGSTMCLTNDGANVTDAYSYDAWGGTTPGTSNSTTDNPYQYVGELGYYSHHQESTLELMQLGIRFYDSAIGRFAQRDLIKYGFNWYAYTSGNPLVSVDPTGLLDFNSSFWNKPTICYNNNCYTYAINDPRPPAPPDIHPLFPVQPGMISGNMYNNYPGGKPSCNNLIANATRDYGLQEQGPKGGCPSGWHKVCLFIDANGNKPGAPYDYHWYRYDGNGYWSHKPGLGPVKSGVIDPDQDAFCRNYETKCKDPSGRDWCMCAKDKPWSR
jgi:RHS repeat-associated protein